MRMLYAILQNALNDTRCVCVCKCVHLFSLLLLLLQSFSSNQLNVNWNEDDSLRMLLDARAARTIFVSLQIH